MNLQTELDRLYPTSATPDGSVRALVLELSQPADWSTLAAVWRGVQTDLELPAPAIAVNGVDGHQLWFALGEPVAETQAMAFLEALRLRYLGGVPAKRLRLFPGANGLTPKSVPALQGNGHWSAYVAPDLAAIFSDEPWLDLPPSPEAQAKVLSGMEYIKPGALVAALELLQPAAPLQTARPVPHADTLGAAHPASATPHANAREFLLSVMNDTSVALPLRIDAAKALLPYGDH